jgi:CTP synthase (UTP-ammonia lyase)
MGVHNVSSTYHVPLLMQDQGLIDFLNTRLDLGSVSITKEQKNSGENLSSRWKALTSGYVLIRSAALKTELTIVVRSDFSTPCLLS